MLNVLHHLGDDYGNSSLSLTKAKEDMFKQLNSLAMKTIYCVFQLGFNWKGDRNLCLFESGTKAELLDFVKQGIDTYWIIEKTGIAVKQKDKIIYEDLNKDNIQRDDSLGEFLNRPLFILKSRKI